MDKPFEFDEIVGAVLEVLPRNGTASSRPSLGVRLAAVIEMKATRPLS